MSANYKKQLPEALESRKKRPTLLRGCTLRGKEERAGWNVSKFTYLTAFNLGLGISWWKKKSLLHCRNQKIEAREQWLLKSGGIPKGKESEKRSPIVSSQTSECWTTHVWNRLKAAQVKAKDPNWDWNHHPQEKSSQFIFKLIDCQN